MLCLSIGLVLRYHRSYCNDSCMSGWSIFGFFCVCVLKLLFRLLFRELWLVKLFRLLDREVSFIIRSLGLDKLFELWNGILSGICWDDGLYFLPSGVVLWDHRADSSDGCLCCRAVLTCHIECMHELFCRLLFDRHRVVKLHELFCR